LQGLFGSSRPRKAQAPDQEDSDRGRSRR
jgi:hypothetical protein